MTAAFPTLTLESFNRCPWLQMGHIYFASGSSAVADLRGLTRWLHPVGVSIPDLGEPALMEIEKLAGLEVPVFVDTGAFAEVEATPQGLQVVRPIDDGAWDVRVAVGLRIARALGAQAYVVAPDRVGDQGETLRRMRRHREAMGALRSLGARVVVPLQRGIDSTARFDIACAEALGFDDYVRAVPGNKDAMPLVEIERFLRARKPKALHVLGMGPKSARFLDFCDVLRRFGEGVAVSYDSNLIAAHVGASNGPGGGPRFLTAMQAALMAQGGQAAERARELAVASLVGPSMMTARLAMAGHPWVRTLYPPVQHSLFDRPAQLAQGLPPAPPRPDR